MPLCFGTCLIGDDSPGRSHIDRERKDKPGRPRGEHTPTGPEQVVDIGEGLDSIRHGRSKSGPLSNLVRDYGLSTPHARTIRRKATFEAPNQTALRLFAAHDAVQRKRGSWKDRLGKVKTVILLFRQPNNSIASFRSVMSSLNKKHTQRAETHLPSMHSYSTSVYLPIGAEFDVYGNLEESYSAMSNIIRNLDEDEESWSSLTSAEVAIWRYAAVTDSPVSNETAATSASSPVASSICTDDEWSVIMGTEHGDIGYEEVLKWSRNVEPENLRTRRSSSIANISDDSQTPSFSLDWDLDHHKLR